MVTPFENVEFRSLDEATILFKTVENAFGTRCAVQTRYIKAINTSIKLYDLNKVVEALNAIDEETRQGIINAPCEDKRQYIQDFITTQVRAHKDAA